MDMNFLKIQNSEKGNQFYKELIQGKSDGRIWGRDKRFNPYKFVSSSSIKSYFTEKIAQYISPDQKVLDVGCGNGVFLPILSPKCRRLVGVDISSDMLNDASDTIAKLKCNNISLVHSSVEDMPFETCEFDLIVIVDVLHHLPEPKVALSEIKRVLKPGGRVLVFEPNKLNPLLWLLCLLDRNEWGALSLGSKKKCNDLFYPEMIVELSEYNGLLLGPDNYMNKKIVNFINAPFVFKCIGWLNPKLFFVLKKNESACELKTVT